MSADNHISLQWIRSAFTLEVDMSLPPQGITAVFGASGSGKTSLLRCVAGLERPAQGLVRMGGQVWQDAQTFLPTWRRPLGYVFQEASLLPHLTAPLCISGSQSLRHFLAHHSMCNNERRRCCNRILNFRKLLASAI